MIQLTAEIDNIETTFLSSHYDQFHFKVITLELIIFKYSKLSCLQFIVDWHH